ncbi:iron dicitrate transport regulator FecR [Methylomonas koyamae]|uniref:Iron dicitrate transport regulator FecR n=1 Tax=Methylomonas koyamae TaxID=702114 RepID=A0A177N040_9GAMM|nr:FecR family protein [Methylomonas koyamae]OAI11225.1 iron dicitrate transport regulator FecR [Methylomonas koyamae]
MTQHQPVSVSDAAAEQAMAWFVRLRAETATPAERDDFQRWYRADPAHRRAYAQTAAFWGDAEFGRTLAAAACLTLVIVGYRPTLDCWRADYCTGVGEIKSFRLGDGSEVTLNSASAISVDFNDGLRRVELRQGEAFFDVQPEPQRPFQVSGRYSTVRVLGTRFAVREDSADASVSVVSGLVAVARPEAEPALLQAGDSITVAARRSGDIRHSPAAGGTAWLKGYAAFENAPLSEVVAELGRYRRGTLLVRDAELRELKVSGRVDIRDTDKALESLQQTLPIRVTRLTPWLVLIGKNAQG